MEQEHQPRAVNHQAGPDRPVLGGVPLEPQDRMARQPDVSGRKLLQRRRRKPNPASLGQKVSLLVVGLLLAFAVGLLTGVALAWGLWSPKTRQTEPPADQQTMAQLNKLPSQSQGTDAAGEPEETTEDPAPEPSETSAETEPAPELTGPAQTGPTEPATTAATEPAKSEYFFPDAHSRYLTAADYEHLSDWELVLARNEIFARHGRRFKNQEIQEYFNGCSWYRGTIAPEDFDESVFNQYERQNIRVLKQASDNR